MNFFILKLKVVIFKTDTILRIGFQNGAKDLRKINNLTPKVSGGGVKFLNHKWQIRFKHGRSDLRNINKLTPNYACVSFRAAKYSRIFQNLNLANGFPYSKSSKKN